MPPFIPQKRRLPTPPSGSSIAPQASQKPTLFQTADKRDSPATIQENRSFLEALHDSEDESLLSQISSDAFEDVPPPQQARKIESALTDADDEDEDDEHQVWEGAIEPAATQHLRTPAGSSDNIELTLDPNAHNNSSTVFQGKKSGPSKIERQIRVSTHCMHVQFLLFHNALRNGWACDAEVQSILVAQLPHGIKKEIERWTAASGLGPHYSKVKPAIPQRRAARKSKKVAQERNQRDWGNPAQRDEIGVPDMSSGDPVIRLLKVLAVYWRKRFTITAPGLRKQGYAPMSALEKKIASFKSGKYDVVTHGERTDGIEDFRRIATNCEGSRDVGAQLFTALIRGLGMEARLVGSLQCTGFGWSKNEEAAGSKKRGPPSFPLQDDGENISSSDGMSDGTITKSRHKASIETNARPSKPSKDVGKSRGSNKPVPSIIDDDDDESVVDVTPSTPRIKPNMKYDRDLLYPIYWTEVISPITNEVYTVESLVVQHQVATNAEHIAQFEPRGAKAEKAKQVFAYVVAHSSDGSAKDVTVRYLKRHIWPGRTRGVRMPIEKTPVYNKKGKIKHHEERDWFKTVMSGYARTSAMRTAVDEREEFSDLKIVKPEKKETKTSEETLQGYKNSADYVLERHFRREEALVPGANPVKLFAAGKGDRLKQEAVYRRSDVEICRTSESWHKEGRAVKTGEHPLKMVPVRAVTLTRKREVEEAERDGGEKLKQGLYARNQTDWIIPPPIENGIIPKNAYGNIDCYVPTMVPEGAVHIPLRHTTKICKRLRLDYAEAVTGFEFGNKRAVPIVTGVVVAEENEHAVIEAWEKDEEERQIREEGKREKMSLGMWRRWLMGLRIVQRVREEYGNADESVKEELNPFTNRSKNKKVSNADDHSKGGHASEAQGAVECDIIDDLSTDGDKGVQEGGGFFPEGHEEDTHQELSIENKLGSYQKQCEEPVSNSESWLETNNGYGRLNGNAHDGQSKGSHIQIRPDQKDSTSKLQKPKPKRRRPSARASTSAKGRKRKASPNPTESDEPGAVATLPKRKAARRSAQALKSTYREESSDDSE